MDTKILAFYLPQFHAIPENDEWWGKWFTEWANVKKAVPLFPEHHQPRVPKEEWYYSLDSVDTLEKQSRLAKKYGVYGFCMYHYWFGGKLLLEKPAEMLLEHPEIDLPYCFSWANQSWSRTWTGQWREMLIEQRYGNESEWDSHFEYLLPFFQDPRYIRLDDKPVFLVYISKEIPRFDDMVRHWNARAKENGLPGICFVETMTWYQQDPVSDQSECVAEFEPMLTYQSLPYRKKIKSVFRNIANRLFRSDFFLHVHSYDAVWKAIIARNKRYPGKKRFLGAFVDWDNSPRKARKSTIYSGSNPTSFERYLRIQLKKSDSEFLFVNAWNEWAEWTYLEPDSKHGEAYGLAVKSALQSNG